MSGIFGIIHRDGRLVERAELRRMSDAMAYRGPDGGDIRAEGSAGLGHLMLHTTPESLREPLPWREPSGGLVITADARIDNRGELCSLLGIDNRPASAIPDSQLILAAYRKWGESCVDYLAGDFAFAIWDRLNNKLFCARDHLGIKPFFYHACDELFVFASSAQAIRVVAGVPRQFNEARIADFLVQSLEGINKTCSFFRGIYRLPPAHTATLDASRLSIAQYWTLDAENELRLGSDDEYLEAFREVFTRAVQARLRCHAEPAAMLSGGIDSSTIVGVARDLMRAEQDLPLRTCSGVSEEGDGCVETGFIGRVIGHGGLNPCLVRPSEVGDYARDIRRVAGLFEDPFDSGLALPEVLYLAARAHGHPVLLDGVDGDLVAALMPAYPAWLLRGGQWKNAVLETQGLCRNYYHGTNRLRVYDRTFRALLIPDFLRRIRGRFSAGLRVRRVLRDTLISSDLAARVNLGARLREYAMNTGSSRDSSLRQAHIERVLAPDLTVAIERYGRVAAYCGVEHRQPLLDKRVVEFCVALPWSQKARNGWSKFILRQLAQSVVPAEVAWRKGWEDVGWKFSGALIGLTHSDAFEGVNRDRECLGGYVNMFKLSKLCAEPVPDGSNAREKIWPLLNLAKWLEMNKFAAH